MTSSLDSWMLGRGMGSFSITNKSSKPTEVNSMVSDKEENDLDSRSQVLNLFGSTTRKPTKSSYSSNFSVDAKNLSNMFSGRSPFAKPADELTALKASAIAGVSTFGMSQKKGDDLKQALQRLSRYQQITSLSSGDISDEKQNQMKDLYQEIQEERRSSGEAVVTHFDVPAVEHVKPAEQESVKSTVTSTLLEDVLLNSKDIESADHNDADIDFDEHQKNLDGEIDYDDPKYDILMTQELKDDSFNVGDGFRATQSAMNFFSSHKTDTIKLLGTKKVLAAFDKQFPETSPVRRSNSAESVSSAMSSDENEIKITKSFYPERGEYHGIIAKVNVVAEPVKTTLEEFDTYVEKIKDPDAKLKELLQVNIEALKDDSPINRTQEIIEKSDRVSQALRQLTERVNSYDAEIIPTPAIPENEDAVDESQSFSAEFIPPSVILQELKKNTVEEVQTVKKKPVFIPPPEVDDAEPFDGPIHLEYIPPKTSDQNGNKESKQSLKVEIEKYDDTVPLQKIAEEKISETPIKELEKLSIPRSESSLEKSFETASLIKMRNENLTVEEAKDTVNNHLNPLQEPVIIHLAEEEKENFLQRERELQLKIDQLNLKLQYTETTSREFDIKKIKELEREKNAILSKLDEQSTLYENRLQDLTRTVQSLKFSQSGQSQLESQVKQSNTTLEAQSKLITELSQAKNVLITKIETQTKTHTNRVAKFQNEIDKLQIDLMHKNKINTDLKESVDKYETEIKILSQSNKETVTENERLKIKLKRDTEELNGVISALEKKLKEESNQLLNAKSTLISIQEKFAKQSADDEARYKSLKLEYEKSLKSEAEMASTISNLEAQVLSAISEIQETCKKQVSESEEKAEKYRAQSESLSLLAEERLGEIARIEALDRVKEGLTRIAAEKVYQLEKEIESLKKEGGNFPRSTRSYWTLIFNVFLLILLVAFFLL